jgi:hypothetical protein
MWNIEDYLPIYPSIDDDAFESQIWRKAELYALRHGGEEASVTALRRTPGTLLYTQEMVHRLMSRHTPYNEFLLAHTMGTGKTCAAVGVVEGFKLFKNRALVLVKGPSAMTNFKNELSRVCTVDQYLPVSDEPMTGREFLIRRTKLTSRYYDIKTFEEFSGHLSRSIDEVIQAQYSNRVIVIDEVHNLRIQKIEETKTIRKTSEYDEIFRLLHLVKNVKILLLSGTPMYDKAEEIASVMNLILPISKQMPIGKNFRARFIKDDGTIRHKAELISFMRGRVSYLKGSLPDVKRIDVGIFLPGIKYIRVIPSIMSEFQENVYSEKSQKENVDITRVEHRGMLKVRTQISNFVYPDGTFGKDGFEKHIKSMSKGQFVRYAFDISTERAVRNELDVLSRKFYDTLNTINKSEQKLCFVYSELAKASGAVVFSLILKYNGYDEVVYSSNLERYMKEIFDIKRRRYALLTGKSSQPYVEFVKSIYNDPRNRYGDYIKVLVGSKFIGEAITLKNTRQIHVLDPHWNDSSTEQAIARGIRVHSHDDLRDDEKTIEVFRHASILHDPILGDEDDILRNLGSDAYMYSISEQKDFRIKHILRIMKEVSVDCPFFRDTRGTDNSRDCDYQACEYKCIRIGDGEISDYTLDSSELDMSSFRLYYADDVVKKIIMEISKLFGLRFIYSLDDINIMLREHDKLNILTALSLIIQNRTIIRDRYGIARYLRHEGSIFYLSIGPDDPISYKYVENPLAWNEMTFSDTLEVLRNTRDLELIDRITSSTDRAEVKTLLNKIENYQIKQGLIEAAYVNRFTKGVDDESNLRGRFIRDMHRKQVVQRPDGIIQHNIFGKKRIYNPKVDVEFHDATPAVKVIMPTQDIIADQIQAFKERFEREGEDAVNIYGVVEPDKTGKLKFHLADLEEDKVPKRGGAVCEAGGWKKERLINVANRLGLEMRSIKSKTNDVICKQIRDRLAELDLLAEL